MGMRYGSVLDTMGYKSMGVAMGVTGKKRSTNVGNYGIDQLRKLRRYSNRELCR